MYCSIDSLCQTCCYICIEQVVIAIHHSHHALKQDSSYVAVILAKTCIMLPCRGRVMTMQVTICCYMYGFSVLGSRVSVMGLGFCEQTKILCSC